MSHKEKLEEAKRLYETANADQKYVLESLFPELKESEDERIRKDLIIYLKSILSNKKYGDKFIESWIAWLEAKGEQKPAGWHREDEQNLNACLGYIPDEFLRRWLQDIIHAKYDKTAWSESDEKQARQIERIVHNDGCSKKLQEQIANWFKSLKYRVQPQS